MKKLKYFIIHCLATPAGLEVSAASVRRFHTSPPPAGRGWKQVGYSKILHLNGSWSVLVENNGDQWVDPREVTNGAKGINSESYHISYVGGLNADTKQPEDTRTPEQLKWMEHEVKEFIKAHPDILVGGHNQFAAKACPCFNVPEWLRSIGVEEKNICKEPLQVKL